MMVRGSEMSQCKCEECTQSQPRETPEDIARNIAFDYSYAIVQEYREGIMSAIAAAIQAERERR